MSFQNLTVKLIGQKEVIDCFINDIKTRLGYRYYVVALSPVMRDPEEGKNHCFINLIVKSEVTKSV